MRASGSAGCKPGYTQGGAGGGGEGGAGGGAHVTPEVPGEVPERYREQCQLTTYSQAQGKQSWAQIEDCWKIFNKVVSFITHKIFRPFSLICLFEMLVVRLLESETG